MFRIHIFLIRELFSFVSFRLIFPGFWLEWTGKNGKTRTLSLSV